MAYATDFIRVSISGTCYQDQEIWNTGFNVITSPNTPIDIGLLRSVAVIVAESWDSFFAVSGQGVGISSSYYTDLVKTSHIGVDGKVVGNEVYEEFYEPRIRGGQSSFKPAPQLALVATLRSAIRKGPAALGRMYLPSPFSQVEFNGEVTNSQRLTMQGRFSSFLDGVNLGLPTDMGVGLASPAGEGVQSRVTRFRIDSRIDTQRRRANHIPTTGDFIDVEDPL